MPIKENTIANKLTALLKENEWSQNRLAEESGVDQSTINHLINNHSDPRISTLKKIADALNVRPEKLI